MQPQVPQQMVPGGHSVPAGGPVRQHSLVTPAEMMTRQQRLSSIQGVSESTSSVVLTPTTKPPHTFANLAPDNKSFHMDGIATEAPPAYSSDDVKLLKVLMRSETEGGFAERLQRSEREFAEETTSPQLPGTLSRAEITHPGSAPGSEAPSPTRWGQEATSPAKNGSQSPPRRPLPISRSGSVRNLPWSPPRSPVAAPRLVVPYAIGKESITEKYAVNWNERTHVGMGNCMSLPPGRFSISSFYQAKAKGNGGIRAVKVIHRKHILYPKLFQQQLSDMRTTEHPALCRVLDVYEDSSYVYLVFDFLGGPSLMEKVLSDPQFCERDAAAAFKVILQAIVHLHGRNIVHQNLHPENLRYVVSPKKKGSGSAYHDQLKLFDFGMCLQIKHLSQDVQATGTADSHPLPLLPLVSTRTSRGEACLSPELQDFKGELGSYGQFAALVQENTSSPTQRRCEPHSPALRRGEASPYKSSTWQEDPVSRQVKELHKLLEAGDLWSAGCILHILLTGSLPAEGGRRPLLEGLPADARELLAGLLRKDPRERLTAQEALQSDWFRRCEALQRAHRSQSKASSPDAPVAVIAPISDQLRGRIVAQHTASKLRKLVLSLIALKSDPRLASNLGNPNEEVNGGKAVKDFMCQEAFQAIVRVKGSGATELAISELADIVEKAGDLPWKDPVSALQKSMNPGQCKVGGTISQAAFTEFVKEACK